MPLTAREMAVFFRNTAYHRIHVRTGQLAWVPPNAVNPFEIK